MNNNLLYYLLDLDIGLVLREHIDKLIKTLDLLEEEEIELANNDSLLNIIEEPTVLGPSIEKPLEDQQLPTPS